MKSSHAAGRHLWLHICWLLLALVAWWSEISGVGTARGFSGGQQGLLHFWSAIESIWSGQNCFVYPVTLRSPFWDLSKVLSYLGHTEKLDTHMPEYALINITILVCIYCIWFARLPFGQSPWSPRRVFLLTRKLSCGNKLLHSVRTEKKKPLGTSGALFICRATCDVYFLQLKPWKFLNSRKMRPLWLIAGIIKFQHLVAPPHVLGNRCLVTFHATDFLPFKLTKILNSFITKGQNSRNKMRLLPRLFCWLATPVFVLGSSGSKIR